MVAASAVVLAGAGAQLLLRSGQPSLQDIDSLTVWLLAATVGSMLAFAGERASMPRLTRALAWILGALYLLAFASLGTVQVASLAHANIEPNADAWRHGHAALSATWLKENARPDDVIMAEDYAALHYATGLRVIPLPITRDAEKLRSALEYTRPNYVVINHGLDAPYYYPLETDRFNVMRQVFPNHFVRVYEHRLVRIYGSGPEP
jgi:hypothetical protein